MSLDKWIKSDKKEETKNKPQEKKGQKGGQSEVRKDQAEKTLEPLAQKFNKFQLKCPKKGCNYQKTIVKKDLKEKDKVCPRCKSTMKVG